MLRALSTSPSDSHRPVLGRSPSCIGPLFGDPAPEVQACERKEKRASIRTIDLTPFGPPLTRIRPLSGKSVRKVQAFGPNGVEISGGQLAGWVLRTGVGVVKCGSYSATRWASLALLAPGPQPSARRAWSAACASLCVSCLMSSINLDQVACRFETGAPVGVSTVGWKGKENRAPEDYVHTVHSPPSKPRVGRSGPKCAYPGPSLREGPAESNKPRASLRATGELAWQKVPCCWALTSFVDWLFWLAALLRIVPLVPDVVLDPLGAQAVSLPRGRPPCALLAPLCGRRAA
jgi:hypothetical protein